MKLMKVECKLEFWGIIIGIVMLACGITLFSCTNTSTTLEKASEIKSPRNITPFSQWTNDPQAFQIKTISGKVIDCVAVENSGVALSCDWAGSK